MRSHETCTIPEFLKDRAMSYQTLTHRIKRHGVRVIQVVVARGSAAHLYFKSDLQKMHDIPKNYKDPLVRKRSREAVDTTDMMRFLREPIMPVHRWYGFES